MLIYEHISLIILIFKEDEPYSSHVPFYDFYEQCSDQGSNLDQPEYPEDLVDLGQITGVDTQSRNK